MAKKTVVKINTNITTGEHFNGDGASFRSSEPQVSYRSSFLVEWRLFAETPNADESGVDLSLWTPADFSGCGAIATCDNDFRHRVTGTLATAINAGETVSSVTIKTSAASVDVPESGMISLYSESGSVKDIEYSGMTVTANAYILQLSEELNADANYPAGSSANISQEPLFQAMYIPEESNPVKGLFVFDCYAYSKRLAALADTSSGRNITVQGLEILPFTTDDNGVIRELPAYLIDTFTLNVNLAEVGAVIPEYAGDPDEILVALAGLIIKGVEIQLWNDSLGWHDYNSDDLSDGEYARSVRAYRIRLSGSTGQWSTAIPVISGANAPEVNIQYSADGSVWGTNTANAKFIRFSVDGGISWGESTYVKGEQGTPAGFGEPVISASTVPTGYPASATITASGPDTAKVFNIALEIPKGETGKRGEAFKFDATGTLEERTQYDTETKDFAYLATDNGNVYIKASDTSGDWSDPIPFKGDKGDMPFTLRGSWYDGIQYNTGDAVTYGGSFYVATASSNGAVPNSSGVWKRYVSKGDVGPEGKQGIAGTAGKDGKDGKDAPQVKVQYSVRASGATWYLTPVDGVKYMRFSTDGGNTWGEAFLFTGKDGENGDPGRNAPQVKVQYYSPSTDTWGNVNDFGDAEYIRFSTDNGVTWGDSIDIRGKDGTVSFEELTVEQRESLRGERGPKGYTPERGVDYWTDEDKAEIKAYVDEAILNGEW